MEEEQITSGEPGIPFNGQTPPGRVAAPQSPSTFRQVFEVSEFRALWTAQVLSVVGDQLARVALTLLVYQRTGSALLSAITFAVSIVPAFVGGLTLSGLADRLPRRQVMIASDLSRAVLVAIMAIPGMPVIPMICIFGVVTMIGAPFNAARAALYPDILIGDLYVLGTAVTLTTLQFAQVIGFAAGGAIVEVFGVRTSLLVDSATFLVSALITRALVRARPTARATPRVRPLALSDLSAGIRLVFGNPALRTPMLLGWLVAFYDIPEGVVAPLSRSLGGRDLAAGLILAAAALGASLGAVGFSRLVSPERRLRWMTRIAPLAPGVLVLFVLRPTLPAALAILTVSGIFDCYQVAANASFVQATPASQRSQAFGIVQGGMSLGQGTAMILAGAAAERFAPALVIATGGVIGAVAAIVVALTRPRAS
ncbi:MAG TPA: MFS transporter [Streptosporangiaceae bacterium]